MRTKWIWSLSAAVSVLSLMAGCPLDSQSPNGSGSGGSGSLKILITDKPFPFEHIASATVTITEVRAHRADADDDDDDDNSNENENANAAADDGSDDGDSNENANAADDSAQDAPDANANDNAAAEDAGDDAANDADDAADDSGDDSDSDAAGDDADSPWVTVFSGEREFNLLDLRNGRTDLLADAELPAGSYDQLRLVVTAGEVTLTDGRVFPLKVPSGEQSGIKLHFEFEVAEEGQTQLLLDVDLSRAFQAIPSGHIDDVSTIRSFKFSPSIAMRLVNLLEAGSISGLVTDNAAAPLEGAAVTAYRGSGDAEEEVTTSVSEADGSYQLIGLPSGSYRLVFSKDGYVDFEIPAVEVQAGAATENVNASLSPVAQ
ncbi:MAG: hypothetical protein AMXMBFR47_09080 [Planctomycetota bacterium]